jgi:hypothetical protein
MGLNPTLKNDLENKLRFYIVFLGALFFSQSFGAGGVRCGTMQFAENSKNAGIKSLAKSGCVPENYYGRVLERKTEHFIIYYTQEKVHAIKTPYFIDSLAKYLEQAYKLHTGSLGMKGISGASQTYHYKKNVPDNLYPVEVLDLGLLRDLEGEYATVFGITFTQSAPWKTQIAIENDFLYGADCQGNPSTKPFKTIKGVDYEWHLALKVTVFHELYHSFQMMQLSISENRTFWLEASATGVEEIGAPEVNDYINYLYLPSAVFYNPGISIENSDGDRYDYAILYLFLFSELGPRFDSAIWSYFSRYPKEKFSAQLTRLVDSLRRIDKIDMDSEELFHKFASQVFYSGQRAAFSQSQLYWKDMPEWPEWTLKHSISSVLPAGAIDFIIRASGDEPPDMGSLVKIDSLNYGDSSVWVLSRLLEKPSAPSLAKGVFAAYPNPWNPTLYPKIHFKNTGGANVEIRSANGALLKRINKNSEDSWDWEPPKKPAPGILYYRTLPYGKNKVLIVEY